MPADAFNFTETKTRPHRQLAGLAGRQAGPAEAGAVEAAGRAVGPRQAAVPGGALRRAVLLAPQLAAGVAVRGDGALDEVLSEHLLALLVQAVPGARRLPG